MEKYLGTIQKFKVIRETNIGYMLTLKEEEFFLHKNETNFQKLLAGDEVRGFVYSDKKARIAVTLSLPNVTTEKAGFVRVIEGNKDLGVFVDIGISKDVLVSKDDLPLNYSQWPEKDDVLLSILRVKNDRLIAKMLSKNDILALNLHFLLQVDSKVKAFVYRITDSGVNLVTETFNIVFVHASNMKRQYRLGEEVNVKILKKNLDDYNGSLVNSKEEIILDDSKKILKYLEANSGSMTITDKTEALIIKKAFGISKLAFKNALGHLYKTKQVMILEDKIVQL